MTVAFPDCGSEDRPPGRVDRRSPRPISTGMATSDLWERIYELTARVLGVRRARRFSLGWHGRVLALFVNGRARVTPLPRPVIKVLYLDRHAA